MSENDFFQLPDPLICTESDISDPIEETCSRLNGSLPDGNEIFLIAELIKQLSKLTPPLQPVQPPNLEPFDPAQCKVLAKLSDSYAEFVEQKDQKKKLDKEVYTSTEKIVQMFPELVKEKREDGVTSNIFQLLGLSSKKETEKQAPTCTFIQQR